MSKSARLLLLAAGFAAALFAWQYYNRFYTPANNTSYNNGIFPAAENAENRADRMAWEQRMLADPQTGQIPEGILFAERQFAARLPVADAESGPDWAIRGPWNVGGRTRALAIDVSNENRILAGGVSGGLWLSEDGGQNWSRRTAMNALPSCVSVAQDKRPGKTDTWYYLSGEVLGNSASGGDAFYFGDGLYKSTDGGLNWSQIPATAGGNPQAFSTLYQVGYRVLCAPVDSQDVVYMACIGAIYRSANGGANWTAVRGGNIGNFSYYTDIAVTNSGVLYATLSSDGPNKGIWRSTNGTGWTNITPDSFPNEYNRIVIGINPDDENEVYFLAETPGKGFKNTFIDSENWSSLWKYRYLGDNGAGAGGQWVDRSANLPGTGTSFDRFSNQGGYDLVIKVQPGTGHVFIGGTNIYRSTSAFADADHTTQIGGYLPGTTLPFFELYPNHHPDQHEILFLPSNPNVIFTGSDGGIHRSDDSNAPVVLWNSLNNGYRTTQLYTAIFEKSTPDDPALIGGFQDNGNFFTGADNPNAVWKQTVNGDGSYGAIPDGKPYYILSIQQGRVVKCAIDDQGNVTAFNRIDPVGAAKSDYQFINPLALDPSDQNILYLPAGKRFFRQSNLAAIALNGAWDSISLGWTLFPDTLTGDGKFSAIGVSKNYPAHRVYLGSDNNTLFRIDEANGPAPIKTSLAPPLPTNAAYISCIAVDPDNGDDVTVVYSNYSVYSMYRSLNGGESWFKVAGNLENALNGSGSAPSLRWLSILPFPDGSRKYYCGTSTGLYAADSLVLHAAGQAGTQWTLQAPDLIGNTVVPFVDTRPSDGLVVAATHGIGMYSVNITPFVGNEEPAPAVSIRVWPNPATDFATIECSGLYGEQHCRLFDQKGRVVRNARWTGRQGVLQLAGLPTGVYYYEIAGKNIRQAGKLLVAKP